MVVGEGRRTPIESDYDWISQPDDQRPREWTEGHGSASDGTFGRVQRNADAISRPREATARGEWLTATRRRATFAEGMYRHGRNLH